MKEFMKSNLKQNFEKQPSVQMMPCLTSRARNLMNLLGSKDLGFMYLES